MTSQESWLPISLQLVIVGQSSLQLAIVSLKGLAKGPRGGSNVEEGAGVAIVGGDEEGEGLFGEGLGALPDLAPVAGHAQPSGLAGARPDGQGRNAAAATHITEQHHVEIGVAAEGEPDAALLETGHAPVDDRHDPRFVFGDLQKRRNGQVEVRARRVAPPTVVAGLGPVGRTEVGGRHHQPVVSGQAPLRVVVA
ncbi:hypothetical protein L7F22_049110 [Adiantum nelumboides]|nr:hypothetical protein [Adiantum nelumboides]